MSDTNAYARERSNSTHEAYLKRIGISPIVIPPPTPSQLPQVLHAPHAPQVSQTQHTAHTAHTVHTPYVSQLLQVQQAQQQQQVSSRVERRPSRLPPPENKRPTGAKGCLCGCIKITGGYLMCPILCSISCMMGACRDIYHAVTCDKYNDGTDPHKLCVWFGCYNACVISGTWIEEGIADMRRKPHVETEMVR
jgi:hypothetical protein